MFKKFFVCAAVLATSLLTSNAKADLVFDNFTTITGNGGGTVDTGAGLTFHGSNTFTNEILPQGASSDYFIDTSGFGVFLQYNFGSTLATIDPYIDVVFLPFSGQSGTVNINVTKVGDGGGSVYNGAATTEFTTAPDALDNASGIRIAFSGGGTITWGGAGSQFVANPEPTSLLMFGSVASLGLIRRRRQS